MFGWFKRGAATKPDETPVAYAPSERTIFSFNDGERVVKADPLVLCRKLMEIGPELSIDIKVAKSQSKDNLKAHVDMVNKLRELFHVKPLSEGGLTEAELLDLFDCFLDYMDGIKKNSRKSAT